MARRRKAAGAITPGSKIKLRSATTRSFGRLSNPKSVTRTARTFKSSKPMVGAHPRLINGKRRSVLTSGAFSFQPALKFFKFRNKA